MNTDEFAQIDCEEPELRDVVVAFVRRFHRLPSRYDVENARLWSHVRPPTAADAS